MSQRTEHPKPRRHRGRPRPVRPEATRRRGGPTPARMLALRVLDRVERSRAFADLSLHHALARSSLVGADRALCTELVYGTLRWRGRIDYLLGQLLDREFSTLEPLVANALRLGAYQILFTERIPATAAVDQAVHCTRALGADRAAGLVNAVLRRLSREHERISFPELRDDPVAHLTHALSMPEWIARRWIEHFGADEAAALARASNDPPRLTLRANRTRTNAAALLEAMRLRFPEALPCRWAEDGIVLGRQGNPGREPGFLSGLFTVQDEASQLVVELLDPRPGDRVLDTCAAPGTKSTGIAERVGPSGEVLSLDRHGRRLALVARDARRLGLDNIRTLERDATRSLTDLADGTGPQHTGRPFDRVLVDAPCSGLGALRRNPDARWRIRPEATEALVNLQRSILARAATVLRPGGRLVYSTCTLLPEENEGIVSRFLQDAGHFRIVPAEEHPERLAPLLDAQGFLHCLPHRHDTDGFFAACLERIE